MTEYQDDDQLADAVQSGDVTALDAFFNRFQLTLIKVAMSRNFSYHDAEELAQETFEKAYLGIASFRRGDGLEPWLVGILKNMMRREWDKKKRHTASELDETTEETHAAHRLVEPAPSADELKQLGRLWSEAVLLMTLAEQNPKHSRYMRVVQLRLDKLEFEEIEKLLGLGKGSAKAYWSKGLKILKEMHEAAAPDDTPRASDQ